MKVIVKESQSVTFRRKDYAPGDEVDLPDKIAKHLIGTGVCETPLKKGKEGTGTLKEEKKDANKKMSNSR